MLDQNQAWRYRVKKIMRVIKIVFSIAFILALLFAIYVIIYLIKYGDLKWWAILFWVVLFMATPSWKWIWIDRHRPGRF